MRHLPIALIEAGELKSWAANFAEPRIMTGDFNGGPDSCGSVVDDRELFRLVERGDEPRHSVVLSGQSRRHAH